MRIMAGACADKYTSEARLSAINLRIRSIVPLGAELLCDMLLLLSQ
jgi:hypothetical protein